jgi:transposase
MSEQMTLSYNTVYNAVQTIRYSILAHAEDAHDLFDGEIELDESYFGGRRKGKRGRGAAGKVPVFGILERNGQVRVTVVPNVTAETLINLTVKTVRRGSIIYTDKFKSYDSLMFCGYRHLKIDHGKLFSSGKVYINGLEGFWSWAKERPIKHHGVSKTHFPLYLKELEFRYNNRYMDIFDKVTDYLCDLVPKLN